MKEQCISGAFLVERSWGRYQGKENYGNLDISLLSSNSLLGQGGLGRIRATAIV